MPDITLPDGSILHFDAPISVATLAATIGAGLAKAALAGKVDDKLVDISFVLENDSRVAIVTDKDAEGLDVVRHSTAHLLAYAVKNLFPDAQVTIGPVIENGFYYDFSFHRPFTLEDLTAIEKRMIDLAKRDFPITREVWPREKAVEFFRSIGEQYKAEIITSIPSGEDVSLYREGDFIDLCRGPHVPSTGRLKTFKLLKVAGAYWRGDSKNEMLQRIYGTAWTKKEDQDAYLHMLEEAEKRDHRRLGKQLDLFHMQDEAPGLVFWHPKGWTVWQTLEQYMRNIYRQHGFQEVRCPPILDRALWERSGHWQNFRENMFLTSSENRDYAIKPMNCPGHIQIFNTSLHSYRDLPLRYGEFGACLRNEPSGALHGLMRVRGFTQDDGHIFCTPAQIQSEVANFIEVLVAVYRDFGFDEIVYRLSTRPVQRVGSDTTWDIAERALADALNGQRVAWETQAGQGAFYGPKIEFSLKDSIGRLWQCGTIQVDFSMPERLGAEYVDQDNTRKTPVMLHRAIVGSLERFLGILIEHYAGAFPAWLAPIQAIILNITERQADFARQILHKMQSAGLRVEADLRNEKITYKIREHSLQKLPYQLIVGDKELAAQTVAVRTRNGEDLGQMPVAAFVERLQQEARQLGRTA